MKRPDPKLVEQILNSHTYDWPTIVQQTRARMKLATRRHHLPPSYGEAFWQARREFPQLLLQLLLLSSLLSPLCLATIT